MKYLPFHRNLSPRRPKDADTKHRLFFPMSLSTETGKENNIDEENRSLECVVIRDRAWRGVDETKNALSIRIADEKIRKTLARLMIDRELQMTERSLE